MAHYDFPANVPTDPKTDIIMLDRSINHERKGVIPYLEKGFKCILDNVWEDRLASDQTFFADLDPYKENIYCILGCKSKWDYIKVIDVPSWFWIHEYYWTKDFVYSPKNTNDKLFLLPMLKAKQIRKRIFEMTKEYHDESFVSLAESGYFLPGEHGEIVDRYTQRKLNPDWYDRTLFSIVVETSPIEDKHSTLFITEKTFKPLAYFHPFVTFNKPGSLKWIKEQGFETYDNIFDESYDEEIDDEKRLKKVLDNIRYFEYDDTTLDKMKHNHHHFYDEAQVIKRAEEEVINPLREILE